jgi:hypothetical protein
MNALFRAQEIHNRFASELQGGYSSGKHHHRTKGDAQAYEAS